MCCSSRHTVQKRSRNAIGSLNGFVTSSAAKQPKTSLYNQLAEQYEQELVERRTTRGPYDTSVAETLNALGLVYHHMSCDLEKALIIYGEALRILKMHTCFQSGLFDAAVTMSDIGDVHQKMGNFKEAEKLYLEALEAFDQAGKKKDHPRVISTLNRLSQLRRGSVFP
mmetsp:Transcript_5195/g.10856  ORF Transcript_5195/g.10856 Transcript_5195/m.10856 type:complete len:168 (-) Transcript_5195:21-524(-)|eukprot:CAMPEP_0183291644 /NCGR_PEP_ID=MMETSP0160_2-20130417/991_1 /TAXON_ID=2839 ORGANISM="Odontella Sinensis, Strain Grunow 1884" /NCGR_SAMPLE_ID=MMETSP0160_2 /ASSEMBLY_ACC=CAM_ASM_000250 /LENGTH=167 /DNA_ID=CAMNT_0025452479 /DNA_START=100 /DNA_END=603 /DNA_ORIENTATION=+